MIADGIGKCAFLIAKKLRFKQGFGDSGDVNADKPALFAALRTFMEHIGEHFFSRSAFTSQQDTGLATGDARQFAQDLLHLWAAGDDGASKSVKQNLFFEGLLFDVSADLAQEFFARDGLEDIIGDAGFQGLDGHVEVAKSRHQKERAMQPDFTGAEIGLEAILSGQDVVAKDEGIAFVVFLESGEEVLSASKRSDLIAFDLEKVGEEQVEILIVFDQSNQHSFLPSCALGGGEDGGAYRLHRRQRCAQKLQKKKSPSKRAVLRPMGGVRSSRIICRSVEKTSSNTQEADPRTRWLGEKQTSSSEKRSRTKRRIAEV